MALVQSGAVSVNGAVVTEPSTPVDPEKDQVECRGKIIGARAFEYVLLHKPSGYITSKADEGGRKTVLDLLPQALRHLNPVGRLDRETEGLLLLTNDGDLLYRLTHPSFDVGKEYAVRVRGDLDAVKCRQLETGIDLDGKRTSPARVTAVRGDGRSTDFHIEIHEGWNRQIRRMCEALDLPVKYLKRVRHGVIQLGDLPKGRWRRLTQMEIQLLLQGTHVRAGRMK